MPDNSYQADVVIVGAGPAGSTAAALLAQGGQDVVLVDRAEFPRDKTCGDGLTPRAVAVLDRLGVLPALTADGYQRINGAVTVAPNGSVFRIRFGDFGLGLPDYGLVVPRFELDERLRRHAVTLGARFLPGLRVTAPLHRGEQVVGVAGQARGQAVTISAPLTIIATGANIGLLRPFGVLKEMPPAVSAIRGYFTGVPGLSDEFEFYFERELETGYAWIFPLADGRANVGLGLFNWRRHGPGEVNVRRLLAEFMARHPRLAQARPDGPAKGYPLRTDYPRHRPAGPGFLLAGEALGLVHPVTGEGIDLAMESGEIAAATAAAAIRNPEPGIEAPIAYSRALSAAYGRFFRGAHLIERLATRPRALNLLIRKAPQHPRLARTIAGINLGVVSPWAAFCPRTWWELFT